MLTLLKHNHLVFETGHLQFYRSLFVFSQPRSTVSEALRSIRTNVLFRLGGGTNKTLLITSSVPKEGKSFMSSNLSAVLAMGGQRVILVDADLRRPSLHSLFELSDEVGLSEVLCGTRTLESVIQPTHIPNLHLIAAGPIPPNPSELLGSETMLNVKRAHKTAQHGDLVARPLMPKLAGSRSWLRPTNHDHLATVPREEQSEPI